ELSLGQELHAATSVHAVDGRKAARAASRLQRCRVRLSRSAQPELLVNFGFMALTCLALQIVTGVVLAMHYAANAGLAFDSVEHIMRDVNWGWMLRYSHAVGASLFFLAAFIHTLRGLYYGSYKEPREVLWILGVLILLLMVATAFMGYSLVWGQMSFWAVTVITNLFSSLDSVVPGLGTKLVEWIWGGFSVG